MAEVKAPVTVASLGVINEKNCAFFLCDIQETFRTRIVGMSTLIAAANFLTKSAKVLDIPLLVTEQVPFKKTVSEIDTSNAVTIVEKSRFSMLVEQVRKELSTRPNVKSVVLFGIEAHVCVLQTTLDLLRAGFAVYLPLDGISSQLLSDREAAIERMRGAGAVVTTSESILYEILGDAKHPKFKDTLPLVKEFAQARGVGAASGAKL